MENMKIEIYKNYGVLGAEKRNKYTYGLEHPRATCSDQLIVEIPKDWELWENQMGQKKVTSPWGWVYDINDVLAGDENPIFSAVDDKMQKQIVALKILKE